MASEIALLHKQREEVSLMGQRVLMEFVFQEETPIKQALIDRHAGIEKDFLFGGRPLKLEFIGNRRIRRALEFVFSQGKEYERRYGI